MVAGRNALLGWHFWVVVEMGMCYYLGIFFMGFPSRSTMAVTIVYMLVVLHNDYAFTILCNFFHPFTVSYMMWQI
jgi:hypothetical protein